MKLQNEKNTRGIELFLVIFLGITSVFSAYSAWQSSLNNSAMSKHYNEGIATITVANSLSVEAWQTDSDDVALYQQYISFQYDYAYATDEVTEEKALRKMEDFENTFFSDDLVAAVNWSYEQQQATEASYVSPFESQIYWDTVYAEANAAYEKGRTLLDSGNTYNTNGDKMGLIVIYFATVMFLLGIANSLKRNELKLALALFSCAIFIFATIQMAMIPFLSA